MENTPLPPSSHPLQFIGSPRTKLTRMIPIDPEIAAVAAEAARDLGFDSVSEMTESLLRDKLTATGNL